MNPHDLTEGRTGRSAILVVILLAAGIIAGGIFSYRSYERQFRAEVAQRLSAVADLKVSELAQWRKERLGDGSVFFQNASFSALVRRFLEKPDDTEAQRQIQTWLEKCQTMYRYDQIRLLDVGGVTRMAIPAADRAELASVILQGVPELLRTGRVAFQDLYRNEHDQRVYLAVLVPILDETDSNRPLGALVLRIDPETYLYPLIKNWPTPSRTAETLLVRRDSNHALFLNELKFQTNTALKLSVPLVDTNVAAVKAALGQEGVVDSRDYRGVPVMAALRSIPDSPWSMVARMDTAEVYAPLRERLWLTVLLMGALLLGAGASVGMVWRQQRVHYYRERHEATEALIASEVRYRRLFESAKDGILILDAETGMVVDVNPFLIGLLGFSHEQFLGKKVWELGFFKDIVANQAHFAELQQREYIRYEDRALETADGRRIEVEFVSNVYQVNHQKVIQCNIRDITERKLAEAARRDSETRYHSLFENMLNGLAYCRMLFDGARPQDFVYLVVNQAFETLTRLKDVVGKKVTEVIPGIRETDPLLFELYGRVASTGVPERIETYVEALKMWFAIAVYSPGKDHFVAVFDVITERKRAEDALRQSEERYRTLFDTLIEGFCIIEVVFDAHGRPVDYRFLEINPAFEKQTGLHNALGKLMRDLAPDHEAHWFEIYGKVALTGEPVRFVNEAKALNRWYDVSAYRLGGTGSRKIAILFNDITESKRAEAAMQESEKRFRTMANSMSQLAWIAKADGFILWYNQRWYDYTGTTPEQMEGWGWQSVQDPKALPNVMENWKSAIASGRPFEMEFPLRGADGRFRSFLTRGQPLKDSEGRVVQWFGTNTDVDELRQAEEKVRLLNAELEQRVIERTAQLQAANKELEAFSYSVSHDLRAPLRHVLGYVEMLSQEAGDQLSEQGRRYLKTITDASQEMGELIDDLLAFSRMGWAEMHETSVELDVLVQKTLRDLESTKPGRNIVWKIPPLPVVQGDPAMLKQVLANLLGNAVKYTRPRDPAEIEVGCAGEEDGRIILFVRDNGVGFDPQYAHKLFGVFQRLHRADQFEGTGVGLANVRRIVARHGGRTWAEGKVNEGATFYFTLKPSADPAK
jgi:PAS domain S-box-containing protein